MRRAATMPAVIASVARFLRRGAAAVVVTLRSLPGRAGGQSGRGLTVRYGFHCRHSVLQGLHRDHLQAVRDMPGDLLAVGLRCEEPARTRLLRTEHLLPDAADGPDLALGVDRARSGDPLATGQRPRRQLVVDAERERHPGARAADVRQLDGDVERELV